MVGGRGGGASGFLGMWGGGWLEEEAGEEDKDGRWETVYACGER